MAELFQSIPTTFTAITGCAVAYNTILGQFLSNESDSSSFSNSTINWGDDSTPENLSTTNNFLGPIASFNGSYLWTVRIYQGPVHQYVSAGNYNVVITIQSNNIIPAQAIVQDYPLVPGELTPTITSANNISLVAQFSQVSILTNTPSFYSLIDWGDNTTSIGNIDSLGQIVSSHEYYSVNDTHRYPEAGVDTTYNIKVLVVDINNKTTTIIGSVTIPASKPQALSISFPSIIYSNKDFSLKATFIDLSNFKLPATTYQAIVDFGDGKVKTAHLSQIDNTSQYMLSSHHKYKHKGIYDLVVVINNVTTRGQAIIN